MSGTNCTAGGKHEWRPIGNTTFSGDTWMQEHRVYGCRACGEVATTTNPTAYYDYRRRKPDEVKRLRHQEQEEYETLCARWKADPDAVEAEHAKAEEERKAHVAAAIEKSRAERAARKGEVTA